MVSTHVGVSLWYDEQTIVHSLYGVVLLCSHYWLDCGTGHTCLQLPSGRVPPCCHRHWNLSYWTDYSAAEMKHPWRWVITPPTVYEREKSLDLFWRKLQVSVRDICIHIIHIAVYPWWWKRAFRSQMLSQEVYCASINEINVYFIASNNLYHVHALSTARS